MAHDNWYTPKEIIEPIREFYKGKIDLDPASCFGANKTIKANTYFGNAENNFTNGLTRPWFGNVWCNPPYLGKNTVKTWIDKVVDEQTRLEPFGQVIMLLNRSDAKWYYDFLDSHQGAYYQFRKRIKFIDGETGKTSSPRYNNDLIYWGVNCEKFKDMCLKSFGKSCPSSFY